MSKYQSIQFAPDGDWITDYHAETVEEVWDVVNDQGSRWFFYPLPFVVTDGLENVGRKRIVSCADGFGFFQGLTVATVREHLSALTDDEREAMFA